MRPYADAYIGVTEEFIQKEGVLHMIDIVFTRLFLDELCNVLLEWVQVNDNPSWEPD